MLSQHPYLFSATIKENVAMFKEVEDEAILEVLERVGLKDKVQSLAQGIHTPIGEAAKCYLEGKCAVLNYHACY